VHRYWGAFWCEPDAGTGDGLGGAWITGNDPADTSRRSVPRSSRLDAAPRVAGVVAGPLGVRFSPRQRAGPVERDAPRRVPEPADLRDVLVAHAAVRGGDQAEGPSASSSSGGLGLVRLLLLSPTTAASAPTASRTATSSSRLYLKQAKAYYDSTGVRLVDYLDVHYYPQPNGVSLSDDESAATQALRLRSLKSLYDPAYVDESWIGTMGTRAASCGSFHAPRLDRRPLPGHPDRDHRVQLGGDDGTSSTLAQAEPFAIFAREGVESRDPLVVPADGSRIEDAFSLYLDYDGAGGRVQGRA